MTKPNVALVWRRLLLSVVITCGECRDEFCGETWCGLSQAAAAETAVLRGEIRDAASKALVAARLYIRSADGQWFFAQSANEQGSAVEYRQQRGEASSEMHTCLSAHPFSAELPPGKYTLTVERGKEYLPYERTLEVRAEPVTIDIKLRRWIDLTKFGWYSGETHVHRTLEELPTAMLADDLNVTLPLTYWITTADTPPSRGDKNSPPVQPEVISVDATHVIYPLNTEYEIFSVGGKTHTLGAVFALNHRQVLDRGVPPVRPIADQVHREGGLLELDKHNWPWSMMLVPVMNIDLYELANNHHWRTEFLFRQFGEPIPEYMGIPRDPAGMSEADWTEFGFQNYYALLNCGFRLRPTAGTASGVHPVPLGFGRVYVQVPDGFSYAAWLDGLNRGRSFVTTGPLLTMQLNDAAAGHTFSQTAKVQNYRLSGMAQSIRPLVKLEVVMAGEVAKVVKPLNAPLPNGGFGNPVDVEFNVYKSTWFAVRCYEALDNGRFRFAHTSPFYVDVPNRPLRPRRAEVDYLIHRLQSEIARHTGVLGDAALQEYRDALARYAELAQTAR